MTQQQSDQEAGLKTLTGPKPDGPGSGPIRDKYLFIRRDVIVGRIYADCCVCAAKEGVERFPGAEMAMTWNPSEFADLLTLECVTVTNRRIRNARERAKNN